MPLYCRKLDGKIITREVKFGDQASAAPHLQAVGEAVKRAGMVMPKVGEMMGSTTSRQHRTGQAKESRPSVGQAHMLFDLEANRLIPRAKAAPMLLAARATIPTHSAK